MTRKKDEIVRKFSNERRRFRRPRPDEARRDADDACAKITNDFVLVSVAALDNWRMPRWTHAILRNREITREKYF